MLHHLSSRNGEMFQSVSNRAAMRGYGIFGCFGTGRAVSFFMPICQLFANFFAHFLHTFANFENGKMRTFVGAVDKGGVARPVQHSLFI